MLINVSVACVPNRDTKRSECDLLLEALFEYQHRLELNPDIYLEDTELIIAQMESIQRAIRRGMLSALEGLNTLYIPDSKGGHKSVYVDRNQNLTGQDFDQLAKRLNTAEKAGDK